MIARPDARHGITHPASNHDDGLEHNHNWARERFSVRQGPIVADAAAMPMPSSVTHDDAIYAAA